MNKKLIVFICSIAALLLTALFIRFFFYSNGSKAYIYIDNELYGVYDISDKAHTEKFVIATSYGYNVVKIENGYISIIESDCADNTCVKTGKTDSNYKPIICMPHRLEIVVLDE